MGISFWKFVWNALFTVRSVTERNTSTLVRVFSPIVFVAIWLFSHDQLLSCRYGGPLLYTDFIHSTNIVDSTSSTR